MSVLIDLWEEQVGWLKMEHRAKLEDSAEIWKQARVVPPSSWLLMSAKEADGWTNTLSLI